MTDTADVTMADKENIKDDKNKDKGKKKEEVKLTEEDQKYNFLQPKTSRARMILKTLCKDILF